MASTPLSCPVLADFIGPFHDLLCVRFGGWFDSFEECMLEIFVSQELEESLSDVKVSVGHLFGVEKFFLMAGPIVQGGFFKEGHAKVPPSRQR